MEYLQLPLERFHSLKALNILILLSKNFRNNITVRLKEVLYSEDKLYLIFEYCEFDLKKYMRHIGGPLPP